MVNEKEKNDNYWWIAILGLCIGGIIALYALYRAFNMTDRVISQPLQTRIPMGIPMDLPVTDNTVPLTAPVDTVDYNHPSGETPNRSQLVTDKEYIFGWDNDLNWFSCDIYNTGPDPVYYSVNTRQWGDAPIRSGQAITVPFNKKDSIKKIFLKCDQGKTALVYINAIK